MREKVTEFSTLLLLFFAYPILVKLFVPRTGKLQWPLFAAINLATSFSLALIFATQKHGAGLQPKFLLTCCGIFSLYIGLVVVSFWVLGQAKSGRLNWVIPYFLLIGGLALFRDVIPRLAHQSSSGTFALLFIGLSYVVFRLCLLTSEVHNSVVEMPTFPQYVAFSFFAPLMILGPISNYKSFIGGIKENDFKSIRSEEAFIRILKGLIKYLFLSTICAEFGYGHAFLANGHLHSVSDLIIAVLVYPLFLYSNFSGMCDIVIGTCWLLGISVIENFDNPFGSRNFQEFWSRWHISLSSFMRDLVFTPLVKAISRKYPRMEMVFPIAIAINVVFLLIGIWHGPDIHFVLFGLSQGLGVTFVHFGGNVLKKRLSKPNLIKYRGSKAIRLAGTGFTYLYFAVTMILFANTLEDLSLIWHNIVF